MGACFSSSPGLSNDEKAKLAVAQAKSREIDAAARQNQEKQRGIIKMLILGAGESGKSTLLKQMITLYGTGFPDEERSKYTKDIHSNVVEAIRTLVHQSDELNASYQTAISPQHEEAKRFFLDMKDDDVALVTPQAAAYIKELWADEGLQRCYEHRAEFQLPDSTSYFFSRVDDISKPGYLPTQGDVLRTRVRTTGVIQTNFQIRNSKFEVYDVGGQKSERKKWIHCFEGVTAVIFVAAISEYDQVMFEDNCTNRLKESIELFESVCNSPYFTNTAMILFLNKSDLFEDKVRRVSPQKCFPEYPKQHEGDLDFARNFVQLEFLKQNKNPQQKEIYPHFTTATSTELMKKVLETTQDIILRSSLRSGGLM